MLRSNPLIIMLAKWSNGWNPGVLPKTTAECRDHLLWQSPLHALQMSLIESMCRLYVCCCVFYYVSPSSPFCDERARERGGRLCVCVFVYVHSKRMSRGQQAGDWPNSGEWPCCPSFSMAVLQSSQDAQLRWGSGLIGWILPSISTSTIVTLAPHPLDPFWSQIIWCEMLLRLPLQLSVSPHASLLGPSLLQRVTQCDFISVTLVALQACSRDTALTRWGMQLFPGRPACLHNVSVGLLDSDTRWLDNVWRTSVPHAVRLFLNASSDEQFLGRCRIVRE